MLELLLCSLTIAALLHLWFRTSFVAEYAHLFGVEKWLKLERLEEMSKQLKPGETLSFPAFLTSLLLEKPTRLRSFLARGLVCPHCLGLWISIALFVPGPHWPMVFPAYALGLWFFRMLG